MLLWNNPFYVVGYGKVNIPKYATFTKTADPTGWVWFFSAHIPAEYGLRFVIHLYLFHSFLNYHCLLYPSTLRCRTHKQDDNIDATATAKEKNSVDAINENCVKGLGLMQKKGLKKKQNLLSITVVSWKSTHGQSTLQIADYITGSL